jgi:hypothetical protein
MRRGGKNPPELPLSIRAALHDLPKKLLVDPNQDSTGSVKGLAGRHQPPAPARPWHTSHPSQHRAAPRKQSRAELANYILSLKTQD